VIESYEQLKLSNQLCFPLYAAARKIVNLYTPYFRETGLTYTQYIVFMSLWEEDGQTVGTLCKKLFLDSGTLTPVLKKMESTGWVERKRSVHDERVVEIHLTEAGWAMRDQLLTVPGHVGACVKLEPDEAKTLYNLLYRVLEAES
jgi:DNA-binding MarR family transcriptional regulator